MSTPSIIKFSETAEQQAYREKCLQEDKVNIDAYKMETDERIKRYRAYTNDPFNPIYTKEVIAGFYAEQDPPKVSLFSQWPLNRLNEPQLSSSSAPLGSWQSGASK